MDTINNPTVNENNNEKIKASAETVSGGGNSSADEDFARLFEESLKNRPEIKEGAVVQGRVVEVGKDSVLVDIGFKSEGEIPIEEFRGVDGNINVKVGDKVDVFVESYENEDGMLELSKEKADKLKIWDEVAKACEKSELVEGRIIERVKGGLSVDIGVKAFLPGSQVDLTPVRNLDSLIGKTFQFKIIKFNKRRGNIVLSRRVLLEKEREKMKERTLHELEEGKIMKGVVKNITDYGAFIDLGGIDGLLHITDMSWKRINHPTEIVQIGDEIEVKVLRFDREKERVSLGRKQITEDPWKNIGRKYPTGTRVSGKVVSITDYGAFIELEEGVEGLVHVSEMSWTKRIKHPNQILKLGDTVDCVILDIDEENRRISLGMKQIEPNPWALLEEKYPVGTKIKGEVKNVTDFGVFIGIEDGIDGLVHVSDISWNPRQKNPTELYKKGDVVEAVVLSIDPDNERISLGIKQLSEDPWKAIEESMPVGCVVKGKVVKITDFGIFVEIEDGVEGLIHASEVAEERVDDLHTVAKIGDEIEAEIIHIDVAERKIGLSIKEMKKKAEKKMYESFMKEHRSSKPTLGDILPEELRSAAKKDEATEAGGGAPEAEPAGSAEE